MSDLVTAFTTCNHKQTYLVGGNGVFNSLGTMTRTYVTNAAHNSLRIGFTFWLMENWKATDNVLLEVYSLGTLLVSRPLLQVNYNSTSFASLNKNCSKRIGKWPIRVFVIAPHTTASLTIILHSRIGNYTRRGQFGFRDVTILLSNDTAPNNAGCILTLPKGFSTSDNASCSDSSTPAVYSCNSNCAYCFGPAANQCYFCNIGSFSNGSSCTPCNPSCLTCSGDLSTQCVTCPPGYNLTSTFECLNLTNFCPTAISSSTSTSSDFLFEDGICRPTCLPPMTFANFTQGRRCNKCPRETPYYNPDDKICVSICLQPYKPDSQSSTPTCILDLSSKDITQISSLASTTNTAGSVSTVGLTLTSILTPADPGSITSSALAKLILYNRYMPVNYPPRLELMFQKKNSSSTSTYGVVTQVPDGVKSKFLYRQMPTRFARYNLHSSFLVNFWGLFIIFAIIIAIWLLLFMVEQLISKPSVVNISKKIKYVVQNLLIIQFYECFGDMVLYFGIDANTILMDSFLAGLSLMMGLAFLAVGCLIFYAHFKLLSRYQDVRKQAKKQSLKEELESITAQNEGCEVLLKDFKDDSFLPQTYLLAFVLRLTLFSFTLAFLQEHPLAQAWIATLLTILMILYVLFIRPFRSITNLIITIVFEVIILAVNFNILILAILDDSSSSNVSLQRTIGEAVIYCGMGFELLVPGSLVVKAVVMAYDFYQQRKLNSKIKRDSYRVKRKDPTSINMKLKNLRVQVNGRPIRDESPLMNVTNKTIDNSLHGLREDFTQNNELFTLDQSKNQTLEVNLFDTKTRSRIHSIQRSELSDYFEEVRDVKQTILKHISQKNLRRQARAEKLTQNQAPKT